MRTLLILAVASATVLFGCATRSNNPARAILIDRRDPERLAWIHKKLEMVSLADGVSKAEADDLAVCYWNRFCPICGAVGSVSDARDYWKATVYAGFIAVPKGDILIHKVTGCISWSGGPTVTNWIQLWQ